MHARVALASCALVALAACDRPIMAPVGPATEQRIRQALPETAVQRAGDRFHMELTAHGAMRPGQPIRISARVSASLATADARVEITLPDVASAKLDGWQGGRPPVGQALPPEVEWRGALAAGQEVDVSDVVQIPRPGYYRVVATAVRLSSEPDTAGGVPIRSAAVRELWLHIDERGGAVHARRRFAELPDTVVRAAGPYRAKAATRARASGPVSGPHADMAADAYNPRGWFQGAPGSYNEIAVAVAYYHPFDRAFVLASDVPVYAEVWRRDQTGDWPVGAHEPDTWTVNGANLFPCSPDDPDEYLVFRAELSSSFASMPDADASEEVIATHGECGLEYFFLETDAPHTRVFVNLTRSASAAWMLFGRLRPRVAATINYNPLASASRYSPTDDRITILERDVWDDYGTFIQGHEYGHAFHQKAWGGITGSCSGSHQLDQPSTLGCAYSEGIADFFSFVTIPGTWMARTYGDVYAAPGTDRSTTEVHVASVLGRLIDPAYDTSRPWDRTAYPGRYLGETIRSCMTDGVQPSRADGIDRLIYCLERQVDPEVRDGYFATRSDAWRITTQSSVAPVPASWSRAHVRMVWEKVLYGQDWTRVF